jgi:hypothetical protein
MPAPNGWVAEWLCSGLQSRGRRFDSGLSLHIINLVKQIVKALFSAFFLAYYCTKNRQKPPENAPKPPQKVAMPLVDMIYFRLR